MSELMGCFMKKGIKGCAYCSCDETRLIVKDTTDIKLFAECVVAEHLGCNVN